jgi:ribosomal protein S18 acetylase RimI-like enzyme
MAGKDHPLDNVIWRALTTRQAEFAQKADQARRFIPEIGPLAGLPEPSDAAFKSLAELAGDGVIAIFTPVPFGPRAGWKVVAGAPLTQLVWEEEAETAPAKAEVLKLGDADSDDMQGLTALTRPGPFGPRTHHLGSYFGIRENGRLVAMAGERMRVPGYTEVSAVCTHPDYLGRGYAATLMSKVMEGIRARGETPFLHSRADNDRAIGVYERLGFRPRLQGHFVVLSRE